MSTSRPDTAKPYQNCSFPGTIFRRGIVFGTSPYWYSNPPGVTLLGITSLLVSCRGLTVLGWYQMLCYKYHTLIPSFYYFQSPIDTKSYCNKYPYHTKLWHTHDTLIVTHVFGFVTRYQYKTLLIPYPETRRPCRYQTITLEDRITTMPCKFQPYRQHTLEIRAYSYHTFLENNFYRYHALRIDPLAIPYLRNLTLITRMH